MYAASVLSSVCIRSSGCDCSRDFSFPKNRRSFLPLSGCFSVAFRVFPPPLSGYHSGSFWSPSRRRPACFSCDFRLLSRRSLVALPSPSVTFPLSSRLSSRLSFHRLPVLSRRRPVAAFLNLCRRFRAADIVRPRPFSGNPVFRQNRLPGRPFGFPAECSGQTGFSAGRRPNEKQQSESGLLHTSIALAGDQ